MERIYGKNPAWTYDPKEFLSNGKGPVGLNLTNTRSSSYFNRNVTVVNYTKYDLLVLQDDGTRPVIPPMGGKIDKHCYFVVEYNLGSDVEFCEEFLGESEQTISALQQICELVKSLRTAPGGGVMRTPVCVQFYYKLDCTDLDIRREGVYIEPLNIHLYNSNPRLNMHRQHFGRSRFHCRVNDTTVHQSDGGPQAAGSGAVYYVDNPRDIQPVWVFNKHYSGLLEPIYVPDIPPGVYIYNNQHRAMLSRERILGTTFIHVRDFETNGVFFDRDDVMAYLRKRVKELHECDDVTLRSRVEELMFLFDPKIRPIVTPEAEAEHTTRKKPGANNSGDKKTGRDPVSVVKEMVILIASLVPIVKGVYDGCVSKEPNA